MEAHSDKNTVQPVRSSNPPASRQHFLLSSRVAFVDQQNVEFIVPVRSPTSAAAAAEINKNFDQKAARITAKPAITSFLAQGTARIHMTDEERWEVQGAKEKQ